MLPYILTFVISTFFTYLVQKELEKEEKKKSRIIIYTIFALFFPVFFAGARKIGVGRDIGVYVSPVLSWARTRSLESYMAINYVSTLEKGYAIFTYIFAQISSNLTLFLAILQLFPCASVFYFAYKKRNTIPMWLVMLTYLLTWYCRSYTIMRQSIAVAFILISIIKFEEKKYFHTICLYILAIFFHSSAIIAIAIYVFIFLNNSLKGKNKISVFLLVFVIIVIITLFYKNVLYFFTYSIELLPEKFYLYTLNENYYLGGINVSLTDAIFRAIVIVMGYYLLKISKKQNKKEVLLYVLFMLLELVIYVISFSMINASRMGYYFYYPSLLFLFPSFINMFKSDNKNKLIANFLIIFILFAFWFYNYPVKKQCETYPYYMQINKEV